MSQFTVALDARLIGARSTGDSTYWRGLVAGLAKTGHDARFLLYSNTVRPSEVPDDPRFEWINVPSRRSRWWSLFRFPLAARRAGAHVIHGQYNLSPLVGPSGITTIHDVSFLIEPSWFRPQDHLLLSRFVHPSARRAKRVITVSETSKRDIGRFYGDVADKIRVTPLACGLGITPLEREEAVRLVRDELGIDQPFLLTVGTRWPRKNMGLAIAAAEGLPDSLPHRLVITGKRGWEDDYSGRRLSSTGYVTDLQLSALYSCAEMYLAPSHYEGFGLTLLEAFACGCPVLCSSGGSHPEVAGDAAHVMPSWEAPKWSEAIADLLNKPSTLGLMRERGRTRERQFSWKATAEATWSIYWEVGA